MTFEEWAAPLRYAPTVRDAYLAGQASARSVYDMSEIALLRDKCAELERERDQWKYTAEIRQQHLEYTIKAQAGEPIYGMAQQRQLNPSPQVRSDVGSLGNTHPTPEPVKAQASEPVGYHFSYTTPFGHVVWDIDYTPRPDAIECYPLVRAHPTTERPYNPLNDYAVISMNPTEPVKAQAGEPVAWAKFSSRGNIIDLLSEEDDGYAPLYTYSSDAAEKIAELEHEKDGMAKAYGFLVIERDRACEQHHEVARKLFELERERDELKALNARLLAEYEQRMEQIAALKAQAGEPELRYNWNEHLHKHNAAKYEHDFDLFKVVEAYVLKHLTHPTTEPVKEASK